MNDLEALITAVIAGDAQALARCLPGLDRQVLNTPDAEGYAPLAHAARSPHAGVDMLRMLIAHGADIEANTGMEFGAAQSVLAGAIGAGDPDKVRTLIDAGAKLNYRRNGYGALLDAAHSCDIRSNARLLALLALLVERGARLDDVSAYQESALRVLSNRGRLDAVAFLIEAGADETLLEWSSLARAVAIGSIADMQAAVTAGASLEDRDFWERTPLLLAIVSGDIEKVRWLLDRGADRTARGRCEKPALFYAVEGCDQATLVWLIAQGFRIDEKDEFGTALLAAAAEAGNLPAVQTVLDAGMDPNAGQGHLTALYRTSDPAIAQALLAAGADPAGLPFEARRALLGLPAEPSIRLLTASNDDFQRGWRRRFGVENPEETHEPFWQAMLRAGVNAYAASQRLGRRVSLKDPPVWCAQRYGQSITFLPDGRIVQVAGEHEDHYDPDFCIYNDVFVHETDGSIRIFAYPEADFPPTDFHTATLVGERLFLIGSLGYEGTRRFGTTPVHVLDTRTFRIDRVEPDGDGPGWIYQHRAALTSTGGIRVWGGKVARMEADKETHADNAEAFVLDLDTMTWRRQQ